MMIILDQKRPRNDLLKAYSKNNLLLDSIAVGWKEVIKKDFLELEDESQKPIGFQNLSKWGDVKGSPGQSS